MTREQVDKLLQEIQRLAGPGKPELIETHISWVILDSAFAYKIKKPMHYSFLDFSTLESRKYYCEREIELNRRLAQHMYIAVLPIKEDNGRICIGADDGVLIDYAVKMHRLNNERQMDVLLRNGKVTSVDILKIANVISEFHSKATIVTTKDYLDVGNKFNALLDENDYLVKQRLPAAGTIQRSIERSDAFITGNKQLLKSRFLAGLFRDCHGDLHTRNIFLLPQPVIFDCIEFNDDYREIDVLNEIAFLCMDLDSFGRADLSEQLFVAYCSLFPAVSFFAEKQLFLYYKAYRANVRAKVNSLRARSAGEGSQHKAALAETEKYLMLMSGYFSQLDA